MKILAVENPEWGVIGPAIDSYNKQQVGHYQSQTLCFALYNEDEEVLGGVIGSTYWNWLEIHLMWVREDLRGQGYGERLLTLAEEEGQRRGANAVFLDTFSFQAPGFYEKYGYEVFGTLSEFPEGHQRFYMSKRL